MGVKSNGVSGAMASNGGHDYMMLSWEAPSPEDLLQPLDAAADGKARVRSQQGKRQQDGLRFSRSGWWHIKSRDKQIYNKIDEGSIRPRVSCVIYIP